MIRIDGRTLAVTTIAGGGTRDDSGIPGNQFRLGQNPSIALDKEGSLFIHANGLLYRLDTVRGLVWQAGGTPPGYNQTSSGDGGPATAAIFFSVQAMASDGAGNLFLLEGNGRVRRIDAATGLVSSVLSPSSPGYEKLQSPGTISRMAVDAGGNIYLSAGNQIAFIDATTPKATLPVVTQVAQGAGAGTIPVKLSAAGMPWAATSNAPWLTLSPANGLGDGNAAFTVTANASAFARMAVVTVLGQRTNVVQAGVTAALSVTSATITSAATSGSVALTVTPSLAWNASSSASWLTVTPTSGSASGTLTYSVAANSSVRPRMATISVMGQTFSVLQAGTTGNYTPYGSSVRGQIQTTGLLLSLLASDLNGNGYFIDNNQIRRLEIATGTQATVAGTGSAVYSGDGGQALQAGMNPTALAFDPSGNLFFTDGTRIRRIDTSGVVTTVAGTGVRGFSGDDGQGPQTSLDEPGVLATDGAGNLYFGDAAAKIRRLDAGTGVVTTLAGGTGNPAPPKSADGNVRAITVQAIATDKAGNVAIADSYGSGQVLKVDVTTGAVTFLAGGGTSAADGIPAAQARLGIVKGLAIDRSGNLYLGDVSSAVVRKVDASTGIISTAAGVQNYSGIPSGDGGPATAANLIAIFTLVTDPVGNLYIGPSCCNIPTRFVDFSTPAGVTLAQTISFAPMPDVTFNSLPVTLSATSSAGLSIRFLTETPATCGTNGVVVYINAAGLCTITASQGGTATVSPATPVSRTFTILKATQGIAFDPPATATVGVLVFVGSFASSSLPVTVISLTPAICTISGGNLIPRAAGTCTLTATQDGNSNYLASTPVTRNITISSPGGGSSGGSSGGGSGGSGGGGGGGGGTGGGSALTVSPGELTINVAASAGATSQTVTMQYQTYTEGAPTWTSNTSTNQGFGWLAVSPSTGTMTLKSYAGFLYTYTATTTVVVNPTGFAAGTSYTGTASMAAGGGIGLVGVTMNVTSQPTVFTLSPQAFSFRYKQGDPVLPVSQSLSVFSKPSGAKFSVSASSNSNWLSVGSGSGTTPGAIPVSVDVSKIGAGTFSGKVTVTPPSGPAIDVPVTLTVAAQAPAVMSVSPGAASYSSVQGGSAQNGQITVSNSGGGTLRFGVSVDSGGWLKLSGGGSGVATPSSPASVGFVVDPAGLSAGLYSGRIVVSDSGSSAKQTVGVTLAVSRNAQAIQLSQTGLSFSGIVNGPQPSVQTVTVSNSGSGTLSYTATASVLSGTNWLRVSQSGSLVSVSAVTTGLAAGTYYGSVNIAAAGAVNSPQTISAMLTVAAATATAPPVSVLSGGVIVSGVAGSKTPVSQSIPLFNPGTGAVGYSASALADGGGTWLSVTPQSGAASPGPGSIVVAVDLSSLGVGVQTGSVRISFDDGTSASVAVVVVATPAGSSAGFAARAITACSGGKASYLIPILRQPLEGSTVQVAVSKAVQAQVIDDCGAAVTASGGGVVQLSFSNKDAGVELRDVGLGLWEGTWTPLNAGTGVLVQVSASKGTLGMNPALSVGTSVTVTVAAASATAAAQPVGIVNAAGSAQATPSVVAPGSYVAIYGNGLSNSGVASASGLPLPTTLNGTQFLLGGKPMPLLFASPGQVNALVPAGLAPNASYPLVVVRGTTQSAPVALTVAQVQPGIYTLDLSGSGQAIAGIAGTALWAVPEGALGRPVQSGSEFLVVYCTGLGLVAGPNGETGPADGAAAPSDVLFQTAVTMTATLGGVEAPVVFAGLTPSLAGLYQVNVQVPANSPTGGTVPLVITARDGVSGAVVASNSVTVAVK